MQNIYLLNIERVLNESEAGKAGRKQLEERLAEARQQYASRSEQAKHASGPAQSALAEQLKAFEHEQMTKLAEEKEKLRSELLAAARQATMELKEELGFEWVLDSQYVILGPEAQDLTERLIERLNEKSSG